MSAKKFLLILFLLIAAAVPVFAQPPEPNLVTNGTFANGMTGWGTWDAITHRIEGGVFEFYRNTGGVSAVVLQDMNAALPNLAPIEIRVDFGNASNVRKRAVIIIHDGDWTDLQVCSFWIAPNTPLQTRVMRTFTTEAWTDAHLSVYGSPGDSVGWIRMDNVEARHRPGMSIVGTECYEPGATLPSAGVTDSELEELLPQLQPTLIPTATPALPSGEVPLLATPIPPVLEGAEGEQSEGLLTEPTTP